MASRDDKQVNRLEAVKGEIKDLKLEDSEFDDGASQLVSLGDTGEHGSLASKHTTSARSSRSPTKKEPAFKDHVKSETDSKLEIDKNQDVIGGEILVKSEPGKPPKLSRAPSQKVTSRAPQLFADHEDKTKEATGTFEVIPTCVYASKYIGYTDLSMDCECVEEWDSETNTNYACGAGSDCMNRLTRIECVGDCGCGSDCQNQRFQKHQHSKVSVFKTEKKGYGLRADKEIKPNGLVYEYIGDVIDVNNFQRRRHRYDEEGIKHFYFMSLEKDVFIDATKRGNLGRFCNHSCNPNCYVDKWVVGEKLRMGIFAERKIQAGEELVFNYNVDRYGADPQPCYCGEPNCTGFLGGKTQTERATKLSNVTIEALGIEDGDAWDTAVAKKPRKKKVGEDDEEYVNNVKPKSLDENGVTKVMATLLQCKEKWIAVKLLGRIQSCEDESVRNRIVKMHGYQILNSTLIMWKDDVNVVIQILEILDRLPRLTRNKISDSKIEATVSGLQNNEDERVVEKSVALVQIWSSLEMAYRIPRKKRDPVTDVSPQKVDRYSRRESGREEQKHTHSRSKSRTRSRTPPRGPAASAPSGPRHGVAPRGPAFHGARRGQFRPTPHNALPQGWFSAVFEGKTYYYSAKGERTWTKPTVPAEQPPPPPKAVPRDKALDDIISQITAQKALDSQEKASGDSKPAQPTANAKNDKDKWRSLPEDRQKKLYEKTLFPHIMYVVNKFKRMIEKEDLKRFARDCAKKIVDSDFKYDRIEDPNKITSRQEKNVKKYVKVYFEKAIKKKKEHERLKAEKAKKAAEKAGAAAPSKREATPEKEEEVILTDDEEEDDRIKQDLESPAAPDTYDDNLKRKRDDEEFTDTNGTPIKRFKSESPPPPPPPPPGAAGVPMDEDSSPDTPSLLTPMNVDISSKDGQSHANGFKALPLHSNSLDEMKMDYVQTSDFQPGSPEAPAYDDAASTPPDSPRPRSPTAIAAA